MSYYYISSGVSSGSLTLSGDSAHVYSGGGVTAAALENGGRLYVYSGGRVGEISVSSGGSGFVSGNVSKGRVSSGGRLIIYSGGILSSGVVSSGGYLYFNTTSLRKNTVKNGGTLVICGACSALDSITVSGVIRLTALHSGTLDMNGKTITLSLSNASKAYMIDKLDSITEAKYTVSAASTLQSGTYVLAKNAASFSGNITIKSGTLNGKLGLDGKLTLGTSVYDLNLTDKNLELVVTNKSGKAPAVAEYTPGTWSTDWAQASAYAKANDKLILAAYGDPSMCPYAGYMHSQLFASAEFKKFAEENLVLLLDTAVPGKSYSGSPAVYLVKNDGSSVASKSGFGSSGYVEKYMSWLKVYTGKFSGIIKEHGSSMINCSSVLKDEVIKSEDSLYVGSGGRVEALSVYGSQYYRGSVIVCGGQVGSACISSGGSLDVKGGKVNDARIFSGGYFSISGGKVNDARISSGSFYVYGGTVSRVQQSSGYVGISSGKVNDALISSGSFHVYGGTVSRTQLSGGYIRISGGKVNDALISSGSFNVYGGTVSQAQQSGGYVGISGGKVNDARISSGGFHVYGGTVSRVQQSGDYIRIYGGKVNDARISSGSFYVHGGTVSQTQLSGGRLYVYSGGRAGEISVSSGGSGYVYGNASKGSVSSGGKLIIYSGGILPSGVVSSGGHLYFNNASLRKNTVKNGGTLVICGACSALDSITVSGVIRLTALHSGTLDMNGKTITLSLSNASKAYMIDKLDSIAEAKYTVSAASTLQSGTYVLAKNAASFSGNITIKSGTLNGELGLDGKLTLGSSVYDLNLTDKNLELVVTNKSGTVSAVAEYTPGTWSTDWAQASAYAKANDKLILAAYGDPSMCPYAGYMHSQLFASAEFKKFAGENLVLLLDTAVPGKSYSGSPAVYLVKNDGSSVASRSGFGSSGYVEKYMSWLKVYTGKFSGIIKEHGSSLINCSSVLENEVIKSEDSLYVGSGGRVEALSVYGSQYYRGSVIVCGGEVGSACISSGGSLDVKGGRVSNAEGVSGGYFSISGGKVNDARISSGSFNVYGGTVSQAQLSGGYIRISGGKVNEAQITSGNFYVYGGTVSRVQQSGGYFSISGGKVNDARISSGSFYVYGGTVSQAQQSGGYCSINGGVISSLNIDSGTVYVYAGGSAADLQVGSSGRIYVYSGGKIGNAVTASGGSVRVLSGGMVDFDISGKADHEFGTVDLKNISGTPGYNITISGNQASGEYILAHSQKRISGEFLVSDRSGRELGSLSVNGEDHDFGNSSYELKYVSGNLVLNVTNYLPDLVIDSMKAGKSVFSSREAVTVTVNVANCGEVTAGKSALYLYNGATKIASASVSSLASGESKEYKFNIAAGKLKSGSVKLTVKADAGGKVAENDENNNSKSLNVKVCDYDLQIKSATVTTSVLNRMAAGKVSVTVYNAGNGTAGKSKVYLYDEKGTKLGGVNIAALGAKKSKTYSITIKQQSVSLGAHTLKLQVDPANAVKEVKENNNEAKLAATVVNYDLKIKKVTANKSAFTTAEKIKFTFNIYNAGSGSAGKNRLYVYDSKGTKLGGFLIDELGSKKSKTYSFTLKSGLLTAGTHNLSFKIDPFNEVRESIEKDNTAEMSLKITRAVSDLQLKNVKLSTPSVAAGKTVKLTFQVYNAGNTAAGKSRLYVYDEKGNKLRGIFIEGLGAKKSGTYSCSVKSGTLKAGSHKLTLKIDALNEIKESKENNNSAVVDLKVIAAGKADAPAGWRIIDSRDLTGDGLTDLLVNDGSSLAGWNEKSAANELSVVSELLGDKWQFGGIGDWNGDGRNELLFRGCAGSVLPETDDDRRIIAAGKLA